MRGGAVAAYAEPPRDAGPLLRPSFGSTAPLLLGDEPMQWQSPTCPFFPFESANFVPLRSSLKASKRKAGGIRRPRGG